MSISFQSFSVTAMRLSSTATSSAPAAPSASRDAAETADRVSLSPGATTPPASETTSSTGIEAAVNTPAVGIEPSAQPPAREVAVFGALDADGDGALTRQEFTDGALDLLRRESPPRANDQGRGQRGARGLERRLDKVFARVDANGDGSVQAGELGAALARADRRGGGGAPASAPHETQPSAGTRSFVSVTYVSIAVQRYSALQSPASGAPTKASTSAPAEDAPTAAAATLA